MLVQTTIRVKYIYACYLKLVFIALLAQQR